MRYVEKDQNLKAPEVLSWEEKTQDFAHTSFALQGEVMVEMTRQALGAFLHARLCSTDRRAGPGKYQTSCLLSPRVPLLLRWTQK